MSKIKIQEIALKIFYRDGDELPENLDWSELLSERHVVGDYHLGGLQSKPPEDAP